MLPQLRRSVLFSLRVKNVCHAVSVCCLAQAQFRVAGVLGATHVEIEHHLEMGRKLLAAGQLAEALSHYHSAVGKVTHAHANTHLHFHDRQTLH